MKINTDEILKETHHKYDEFDREQYIIELDIGETFFCGVKDAQGNVIPKSLKEYQAKYINCHMNCQWQDKGLKKDV